jgi:hypothetical protein
VTSDRLLDPDEAFRRLETRLGPLHARLRLGIEREHEAQAFGQGLNFLHLENLPLIQAMIEVALRVTGTYWRGRANADKVQLRRNTVRLPNLPSAFDGFTILHLSDLHADISGPAMRRTAELVLGLDYDLCVLTGDYRGRTYGDCMPCLEGVARLRHELRGDIYAVLGNHDSIAMVPHLEALGIRTLLNECCSDVRPFIGPGAACQGGGLGRKKHENGRKKQECREPFHHMCLPARFFRCMCRIEQTRSSEMSNAAIIVLADAEAVRVRTLADRLRMHPADVVKDLRGRGYRLGSIRGAAGRWTMALKRGDAERYLADRREAGAP